MQRQVLYVDSIIASSRKLVNEFISGLDPHDDQSDKIAQSFAMAVSDVLNSIGVPQSGVQMAIGGYAEYFEDPHDQPIPCFFCGNPATELIHITDEEYRAVCFHHYLEHGIEFTAEMKA
jgi:hypothetical protein